MKPSLLKAFTAGTLMIVILQSVAQNNLVQCTGNVDFVRINNVSSKLITKLQLDSSQVVFVGICDLTLPSVLEPNVPLRNELCHTYFDLLTTGMITDTPITIGLNNQDPAIFSNVPGSCETFTGGEVEDGLLMLTLNK